MSEVERDHVDIRQVHPSFVVDESLWSDGTWTYHIFARHMTKVLENDDVTYYDRRSDEDILERLNEWLANHEE